MNKAQLSQINSTPSQLFNHPDADNTAWSELIPKSYFFSVQRLMKERAGKIIFRLTSNSKLLILIKLLGLFFFVFMMLTVGFGEKNKNLLGEIAALIIASYFIDYVFKAYWLKRQDRIFDDATKTFYIHNQSSEKSRAVTVDYKEMHALQIIHNSTRKSWSYELNLVLHNGNRVNVTEHGKIHELRQDALYLSTALCLPIWDATK